MKWIKNGNQLINMFHVMAIDITDYSGIRSNSENDYCIHFVDELSEIISTLAYENIETAEAHLEAIAMFLENSNSTIMAMAPTLED